MKKILLIDDNESLREIIAEALQLEGFDVTETGNGQHGIDIAKKQNPDIILCDIMMPELDGYQVYRLLKDDPATSLIPFIFLSALAEKDDLRKGMNLGADDYITKPISLKELLTAIYTQLEKSGKVNQEIEKKTNELRERIIHVLPHEFLTPLHAILGLAGLMKNKLESFSNAELREMASTIESAGSRLHNMINNYISYARIASVRGFDNESGYSIQIQKTISNISEKIAEKYHRTEDLILHLTEARLTIEPNDFEFLITELVDNAFKFSMPKSNVIIENAVIDNSVVIRISDQGIGFPTEKLSEIGAFNQFNRNKLEQQGSGLGLITSMMIVERYSGKLDIVNDKSGTIVIVTLPTKSVVFA
ncbi:MAG TPA: hybrid sensor histidine kinase/response regulator [Prolixibacteraceae bacterium]|nr:hybrid sensor histidine kinase/response regulator [Prolixibacteraceae bacterium]